MTMVTKIIQNYHVGKTARKKSGFNFRMTEMQGAVGIAQLKKLKLILKMQKDES